MTSFIRRITTACVARRSRVRIGNEAWNTLIAELGHRTGSVREAGAFLLARAGDERRSVVRVVYFDDVDPDCLTGGITMHSTGFDALWSICNAEGLRVVADVHTHPGDFVRQSAIDRANPMIASAGHVAIIVPDLASRLPSAQECGVHTYRGAHTWEQALEVQASRALYIGRWA